MPSTKAQRPRQGPGPLARLLGALAVLAAGLSTLALLTALGCAGGGGGGGDAAFSDEPAPPFPSVVEYTANSLSGGGLAFAPEGGGGVATTFFLEGTYAKASHAYTLRAGNVPRVAVTPTGLPFTLLHAEFGILVEEPFQWTGSGPPVTGRFRTVPGNGVRLSVTSDAGGSGLPGADVEWIEFGAVTKATSLTWDELEAVLDTPSASPSYVVEAAFAYDLMRALFDQVRIALDATEFVTLNDAVLTAAGSGNPVTRACDPFTGTTGTFDFTWTDGPGEFPLALGSGDHFAQTFHDCWRDEPASPRDRWLQSGTVEYRSYAETPSTVLLGFEQVIPRAVVETRTEEVAGTPTPGAGYTVDTFGGGADEGFRLLTVPDTSGTINLANALSVASAAIGALQLPREVGDLAVGLLAGLVADPSFDFCNLGGVVVLDPVPTAVTATPADFAVTFTGCVREPADPVTFNGVATLHVDSVTGGTLAPLATDTHAITLRAEGIALNTADAVGTSVLSGATAFTRTATAGDLADRSDALAGGLAVAEAGVTRTLSAYALDARRTAGGAYTVGTANQTVTLTVSNLAGPLAVTVLAPVTGTDPDAPASGDVAVEAPDGSALTIGVDGGVVTIAVDTDGDGTPDDILGTFWIDLN